METPNRVNIPSLTPKRVGNAPKARSVARAAVKVLPEKDLRSRDMYMYIYSRGLDCIASASQLRVEQYQVQTRWLGGGHLGAQTHRVARPIG